MKKMLKRFMAVMLAITLVLSGSVIASAESSTESVTEEPYLVLSNIKPLKAGETATVQMVAEQDIYMNAFQYFFEVNTEKVEVVLPKTNGNKFITKSFSASYGSVIDNYSDEKQISISGANAKEDSSFVKAGTVIAEISVKALTDLTAGDVIMQKTGNSYFVDNTLADMKKYDENTSTKCVVEENASDTIVPPGDEDDNDESDELPESSYITLTNIKPVKAGETATVQMVAEQDIYMNAFQYFFLVNKEKVELILANGNDGKEFYTESFKDSYKDEGYLMVSSNYVAEESKIYMAGTNVSADSSFVKAGMVIAEFNIKALCDLSVGEVIIEKTGDSFFTDDTLADMKRYDENTSAKCVVEEDDTAPEGPSTDSGDFLIDKGVLIKYRGESKNVVIPAGVTSIGASAFEQSKIEKVRIPKSVTSICEKSFADCKNLKDVIFEGDIKSIGDSAFLGDSSLKSIMVPESVTAIGVHAIGYLNDSGEKTEGFLICGMDKSVAQQYAKDNDFAFRFAKKPIALPKENTEINHEKFHEYIEANEHQDIVINNDYGFIFRFEKGTMKDVENKEVYDFGTEFITDFSTIENEDFKQEDMAVGIHYNYSGELPGTAKITIPVDSKWIGKVLYYYEILSDGTLRYTGQSGIVSADGTITINQSHCSDYVLSAKEASIRQGDTNGDGEVTAEDALAILKHVANMTKVADEYVTYADVDKNGTLTAEDALMVLKYVANIITEL